MLGIVQVNLALPSLNRDFPAIATINAPLQLPPKGGEYNYAAPLFFAIIAEVEGSLPFREG